MQTVFSIAVDALAYGMVLFVISIGLSVTMGLMRVVNLAHGAFAMIGGYIASYVARDLGLGYAAASSPPLSSRSSSPFRSSVFSTAGSMARRN